ncbi:MAG: ABC transporter permease [Patescibacteria group bacterium]|nr:ABC transporter permease [Patescibacteria group bacterium]
MNAIYILWLRQVKRYFRSKSRIIGSLGQPFLFLVALSFGLGPIFQKAGGGNYMEFLAPGVIAMGILFTALFSGIEIIWDKQFGFLKETLVAPVTRIEIMIGRTLGGATISMIQGIIVLIIAAFIGFTFSYTDAVVTLAFMFLVAIIFTALGTAIASMLEDMQGFQLIMNFLVMPIFFFSGALFPLNDLPESLRLVTKFNPLSYGVDGLRGALVGSSNYGIGFDFMILAITSAVLLLIGGYLFSKIEI